MSAQTTISLARGAPSLDLVPVDELREAADRAFSSHPEHCFSYGPAAGHPLLVEWIAARHRVTADQVFATNGSMQADAFFFQELVEPGDLVVVEAPTYDRTLLMLRELGAEILAIPLEADGLDVGALERALDAGARPRFAHVIPNFQNPAGCTLSREKRERLLALARRYDFLIFEDDPYVEVRFAGEPLPRIFDLDAERRHVVYVSSFTKTVCPGVRVGYVLGDSELVARLRRRATNTYISPCVASQGIVAEFCRGGGFERALERVRSALRERRDALCDALREHLPEARFVVPEGGYFLWVDLPDGDVRALEPAARERGVVVVKGTDFLLEGGKRSLRLAYSAEPPERLREGVARLAAAYRELSAVSSR